MTQPTEPPTAQEFSRDQVDATLRSWLNAPAGYEAMQEFVGGLVYGFERWPDVAIEIWLRVLDVQSTWLTNQGAHHLATSNKLSKLEHLCLFWNLMDASGVREVLRSPN